MGKNKYKRPRPGTGSSPLTQGGMPGMGACGGRGLACKQQDLEEYFSPGSTVASLLERLLNPNPEERESVCTTIAGLVCQPGAIQQFMRADLVRVLGPLVMDKNYAVRVAALGALRNVSVDGGSTVCEEMVRQDVMTPLMSLLLQFSADWTPTIPTQKSAVDLSAEMYQQALHLLLNVCESSNVAIRIMNQNNIAHILLQLLNSSTYGYELAITAAQCLYTASEDNLELFSQLDIPTTKAALSSILAKTDVSEQNVYLCSLVLGVLVNLSGPGTEEGEVLPVVTILANTLSLEHMPHLHNLQSLVEKSKAEEAGANIPNQNDNTDNDINEENEKGDMEIEASQSAMKDQKHKLIDPIEIKHRELEELVSRTQDLLHAQEICLELTANLCCPEMEGEWEDCEVSDSSSDDLTEDMEEAVLCESVGSPNEVYAAFQSCDIISKVLSKLTIPGAELCTSLNSQSLTKKVVKNLQAVVQRGLLCMANLVSSLDVEALGGPEALGTVWDTVFHLASDPSAAEEEFQEAVTTSLRAIIEKLVQIDSSLLAKISEADLEVFYQRAQQSTVAEIRVNYIRVFACLCCHLVNKHQENFPKNIIKSAGVALLQILQAEKEIWVAAEIIDVLMDIFADDCTDMITREIGLVTSLRTLMPQLITKISAERKQLGSHLPVITTVKSNLVRFIKYKVKRGIT